MLANTAHFDPSCYSDFDRLNGIIPGDPIGAYYGLSDQDGSIPERMLAEEKLENAEAMRSRTLDIIASMALADTVEAKPLAAVKAIDGRQLVAA